MDWKFLEEYSSIQVVLDGEISYREVINAGVPQGLVFSPGPIFYLYQRPFVAYQKSHS